jgi:5,5'-dehydrodivanillate O-demethylase
MLDDSGQTPWEDFAHTGPGTLAGRFLRQFWQPVAMASELGVGDVRPLRIMSEDYTLYRGTDGVAHVVEARCPHRGTLLSVGWVDQDCLRCVYHGWKFAGDGQCVETPGATHYAAGTRIASYPTQEFLGLIFAYLGTGEPPVFPPFPDFTGGGITETRVWKMGCNYFQSYENDFDEWHVAWTHRTGGMHTAPKLSEKDFEETEWGVLKRSVKVDGSPRVTAYFMPHFLRLVIPSPNNITYQGAGPAYRDTYLFHTPIDDESHLFFASQEVRLSDDERDSYLAVAKADLELRQRVRPIDDIGEEILAGRAVLRDYLDHPELAALEDYLAQVGQGRIADRTSEHLVRTDVAVVLLRRIFSRELRAIAEGRDTKNWAQLTEMPGMDIIDQILQRSGTGVVGAVAAALGASA